MNGVALLLAAAALGVDYGWQPTSDGQLEYIIQIEPVTLVALRGGQELISQIDPYVRGVRRFRIRVGTDMVPRRGTPPRQPAAPQNLPLPPGVQYGWRGIDSQQMEFIIQLSHERMVLMRGGEELVGEIPAELQNVAQLRIRSGVEPPPRQGLQVASAVLPTENAGAGQPPRETPPAAGSPAPDRSQPLAPAAGQPGPPVASPPRMDSETRQPMDARPPERQPGESLPAPATGGWSGQPTLAEPPLAPAAAAPDRSAPAVGQPTPAAAWPNSGAPMPNQPASPIADPRYGNPNTSPPAAPSAPASPLAEPPRQPAANLGAPAAGDVRVPAADRFRSEADAGPWPAPNYNQPTGQDRAPAFAPPTSSWTTDPVPAGSGAPNPAPLVSGPPPSQPGAAAPNPGFGVDLQGPGAPVYSDRGPTFNTTAPGGTINPGSSVYNSAPQTAPNAGSPTAPPTVQIPQVPQWPSGNQSGWTVSQDPALAPVYPNSNSRPFDMAAEIPRMPWERRLLGSDLDIQINESGKDFWASLAATAQDPSLAYLHGESQTAAGDRPWGPLALALMVMFVSLGANLYLGWIAMDMYQRYLELADDLTERDSPRRNSLDDDPLDEEEDWDDLPRRRHRATIAA